MDELQLIGRKRECFLDDIEENGQKISAEIEGSKFVVIGGAGSIGRAVSRELFKRNPKVLHVVDISENSLVSLVRDLRSSFGYIEGDFQTFCIDATGAELKHLFREYKYDYVLNLSALKHVRSEQNRFSLMRMIEVNVFANQYIMQLCDEIHCRKFFCVSTDKAANPANIMGATKRIMEKLVFDSAYATSSSMARFANVAYSDGSLLAGFRDRISMNQPISCPIDIQRYFILSREAANLCLLSTILGQDGDIYFPNNQKEIAPTSFLDVAEIFLEQNGYKLKRVFDEDEARAQVVNFKSEGFWPVYTFESDTTGEKSLEEFYTDTENVDFEKFREVGIIQRKKQDDYRIEVENFVNDIIALREVGRYSRDSILELITQAVPEFEHIEKGKFLDQKM